MRGQSSEENTELNQRAARATNSISGLQFAPAFERPRERASGRPDKHTDRQTDRPTDTIAGPSSARPNVGPAAQLIRLAALLGERASGRADERTRGRL